MDRLWYVRLAVVLSATIAGWIVLWPSIAPWIPAPALIMESVPQRIAPGLDIRGGLRLMYSVEVAEAIRDRRDLRAQQLLERLGEKMEIVPSGETPSREQMSEVRQRVRARAVRTNDRYLRLEFQEASDIGHLDRDLVLSFGDLREVNRSEKQVTLAVTRESVETLRELSVEQARQTIENRIDEMGLREAAVRTRETDIIVEVPGASDADFERIVSIIERTAQLKFQIEDDGSDFVQNLTDLPAGFERGTEAVRAGEDRPPVLSHYIYTVGDAPCPEGLAPKEGAATRDGQPLCGARERLLHYLRNLSNADRIPDDHELLIGRYEAGQGEAIVSGWRTHYLFRRADVTGDDLDDAQVGVDQRTQRPVVNFRMNANGARAMERLTGANVQRRMAIVLDGRVESAPNIESRIGARGMITLGGYRDYNTLLNEAKDLVVVLRAGALPAPITPQNQNRIGPTLGRDSVQQGAFGAVIGVTLVLLFMGFYYQVAGVVADLMVVLNLMFLLALMAAFGATLTLPGVAGIALTIGMAVDANVLINERIREELRAGKAARAAVDQGFRRAFWSIFDSQFTTFAAGVVLYQYGTGPIRGFAVTLMIGILTSLFTGVFCSKVLFDWVVRGLRVQRLRVG